MFSNQYKWWTWASVNKKYLVSICALNHLSHSPLGSGRFCLRTSRTLESLIRTTFSALLTAALPVPPNAFPSPVWGGSVDQSWSINGCDWRKPNLKSERSICSLLHLLLSSPSLLRGPAGSVEGFNLGERRIPWQRSIVADGRREGSRFWSWGAESSRNSGGLVSHRPLCLIPYTIRRAL